MGIELSARLESIVSLVPKGSVVCDIGCDHALLPIALIERGVYKKAIAMDVNAGPLKGASENVRANCLSDKIELRLSDGFKGLKQDEADCIVIAGMGGLLMLDILKAGEEIWKEADCVVLSPHRDEIAVRKYMSEKCHYDTDIWIYDDGHFYSAMRFLPKVATSAELSESQMLLGLNPTKEYIEHQTEILSALLKKLENVNSTDDIIEKQRDIQNRLKLMEAFR